MNTSFLFAVRGGLLAGLFLLTGCSSSDSADDKSGTAGGKAGTASGGSGGTGADGGSGGTNATGGTSGASATGASGGKGGTGTGGGTGGKGGTAAKGGSGGNGGTSGTEAGGTGANAGTGAAGTGAGGGSGATGGSTSGASGDGGSSGTDSGDSSAAALAAKLGLPSRLAVGLGGTDEGDISGQSIQVDLFERYLVSLGDGAWPTWNQPDGAYVDQVVGATADGLGAVPMFTLYQMATAGDGNIGAVIGDVGLMQTYWAQATLLFQRLAIYGKPALVSFEPDFWGYTMLQQMDPTALTVLVLTNTDCADLPDDVTGFGKCLVQIARKYAPNAYIGFPPSDWGFGPDAVIAYLNQCGAADADYVTMQTLDADAGCFEAQANDKCKRDGSGWYWSDADFQNHLAEAKQYHDGFGKPLIWWQTPLGVASDSPGGTDNHFRDNRVSYFLSHAADLVAAGGLGAVFSAGDDAQTSITSDGGQFKTFTDQYLANPAALP